MSKPIDVYQADHDGFYVGPVKAYSDPKNPGSWLIPAGAVEVPVPAKPWGMKWPQWAGYKWKMVDR